MDITISVSMLIGMVGCLLLVLCILQLISAVYVRSRLPEEDKPLAIYWELFLWVSFGSTAIGLATCAWLNTYLK